MYEVACGHVFALRAAVSVDAMFYTCHSNVLPVHHPVQTTRTLINLSSSGNFMFTVLKIFQEINYHVEIYYDTRKILTNNHHIGGIVLVNEFLLNLATNEE